MPPRPPWPPSVPGYTQANYFDPETGELGVYALFFAIFLVAAIVPYKLAFLPGEVRLLSLPPAEQLGGFRLTLPTGVPGGHGRWPGRVAGVDSGQ